MINGLLLWEMTFTSNFSNCSDLNASTNGIPANGTEALALMGGSSTIHLMEIMLNTADGMSFSLGNRTVNLTSLLCLTSCEGTVKLSEMERLNSAIGCNYNVSIIVQFPYQPLVVQSTQLTIGEAICLPQLSDLDSNGSLLVYQCEMENTQSLNGNIVIETYTDQCIDDYMLHDFNIDKTCGKAISTNQFMLE